MSQKKPIKFITPFTTLDFPEHLSCIVWFSGCNMRCPYCYNTDIVLEDGEISVDELMLFLQKRVGLLDGVVLSGGECTLYGDIVLLCQEIKSLGFKIKLDTNGAKPKVIKALCEKGLIDFVALDFKAPKEKFFALTNSYMYEAFEKSLDFLICSNFPFEARTTLHEDLLEKEDIEAMADTLHVKGYNQTYFIQYFLEVPNLANLETSSKVVNFTDMKTPILIEFRNI